MGILLEANEIRVEFGTLVAVKDVSFKLAGGELLGLVGPNGAGKTTLLRVLAGLHAPTRGEALVLGKPVLGEDEIVRQHIGFAPDAPPAYEDLTIHKFLRFIARAYMLDRDTAAERIDFWLEHLWLEQRRHSVIKTLSRGMRQRLTLARAFLSQPHVILLDEPLSGLDPAGRVELRRVLNMLRDQGRAMIVSSHILADLEEVATHIAILEHGSILRLSTTDAMAQPQGTRRLYRLTLIDGAEDCAAQLADLEEVEQVSSDGRHLEFEFSADERDAAALLKQLLALDMPITAFGAVKTTLEDAYIRAGIQQVD